MIRISKKQDEHDSVVMASAQTYDGLRAKGLQVSINPGSEKNRFVGTEDNPQYPDVIVWKPTAVYSTQGVAQVIEEIETTDSVTVEESNQWRKYSQLGATFRLIVPDGYGQKVISILRAEHITVSEIWCYYYNAGRILFKKYA